jgi:probable phosphomutase (TIGR03848 family)
VTALILLRHGRSSANVAGVLAGRTPGVELDDVGQGQAQRVVERFAGVPVAGIVCSPMLRCEQTVAPLAADRELEPVTEPELAEVDYGAWTGGTLAKLSKEPLWKVVQAHPSAAVFPGDAGEGLAAAQTRAVAAVRAWDARITAAHGADAVWVACSHGDIIKALLADALGMHLDLFQRIMVDPCSVSAVSYTATRPFVLRVNDTGGDVAAFLPAPKKRRRSAKAAADAVVGGGAGPG